MAVDFIIKKDDDLPNIRATLFDGVGVPVNLSAATVEFRMASLAGGVKASGSAVVVDAANGVVEYAWQAGDTDTVGRYRAEFKVTIGGELQTFPTSGYISVSVEKDVDG